MPAPRSDESSITRLILSQFRWLDRAINPTKLAEKMLEMLQVRASCPFASALKAWAHSSIIAHVPCRSY